MVARLLQNAEEPGSNPRVRPVEEERNFATKSKSTVWPTLIWTLKNIYFKRFSDGMFCQKNKLSCLSYHGVSHCTPIQPRETGIRALGCLIPPFLFQTYFASFKLLRLPCWWYSKLVPSLMKRNRFDPIAQYRENFPNVPKYRQFSNQTKMRIFRHVLDVFSGNKIMFWVSWNHRWPNKILAK